MTPLLERVIGVDYNIVPLSPRTAERGFQETIGIQELLILQVCLNFHQPYMDQLKIFIRWVVVVVLGAVRPRWQSSHVGPVPERTAWIIALRARDLPSAMNVRNP